MKRLFFYLIAALSTLSITSCEKDTPDPIDPVIPYNISQYILNCGNWGSNDATFCQMKETSPSCDFKRANGKALGDLAEDAFVYGSKIYLAVYGSSTVFAINKTDLKIAKTITGKTPDGDNLSPRYFAADGNKVYVSFYEGYVGAIDTTSLEIEKIAKVGDNPEQIAFSNGKLFVANSGGLNYPVYGNTVSILNAKDLSSVKTIEVVENPNKLLADENGNIWLISWGNFADIPAKLQKIDGQTYSVTSVNDVKNPNKMALCQSRLYILTSEYDEYWNIVNDVVVFNTASGFNEGSFFNKVDKPKNLYSVSVGFDEDEYLVFVGCSDYISTGEVHAYSTTGSSLGKFESGGFNPEKVVTVITH